jgi:hypothetical protein
VTGFFVLRLRRELAHVSRREAKKERNAKRFVEKL